MIALNSRPKRQEGILTQQASGSLILLNLDGGTYYSLNQVGYRVWELCDGSRNVSEIISAICQEYQAPTDVVEPDVLELLGDLASEKLLVEGE